MELSVEVLHGRADFIAKLEISLKETYTTKKKRAPLINDEVCVIKISKKALFEFIYEKFIDDRETYLDIATLAVTDSFYIRYY